MFTEVSANHPVRNGIVCLGLVATLALVASGESSDEHLVNVGDHRPFLYCAGQPSGMTVVLESGPGAGLETWKAVQSKWMTYTGFLKSRR